MSLHVFKVGGCVRDRLLREQGLDAPTGDIDWVVTGATPEAMLARGFIPVGADFPVFLHPSTHEEYALARTERKTAKGYHGFTFYTAPDVTLEEDLRRRDLTINAMAEDSKGNIIDPWGGQADIKSRVLRHVSEAFCEDPVRILRLARFAARFPDFAVAPETLALCRQMVDCGEVDALVPERTWQELRRGLAEVNPVRMIEVLEECGVWNRIFADISVTGRVREALLRAAQRKLDTAQRTALLFAEFDDPVKLRQRLQALRVDADTISLCEIFCRLHHTLFTLHEAGDYVTFLEAADVLRRPSRFESFLATCAAFDPQIDFADLRLAARAFIETDAGAAARQAQGKNVAQAVRQARLAAVKSALCHSL